MIQIAQKKNQATTIGKHLKENYQVVTKKDFNSSSRKKYNSLTQKEDKKQMYQRINSGEINPIN